MKVHLLSLRDFAKPGGATTYCVNVARVLRALGHDVQGLCPSSEGAGQGILDELPYHTHAQPRALPVAWRFPTIGASRRFAPIVQQHCAQSDAIVSFSLPYVLACKRAMPGIPVIYACGGIQSLVIDYEHKDGTTSPSLAYRLRRHLLFRFERHALLEADAVLCLSESYRERMRNWFNVSPPHWHVCAYGVADLAKRNVEDRQTTRTRLGLPQDAFVVIDVAVLTGMKNTVTLVEGVGLCRSPHVHLLIVGDGPQRPSLEQRARELGIADRVRFAGFVQNPAPYYCASDVFAHASEHEPFGLVYLEAMTCGLPIVGPACVDGRGYSVVGELIREGKSGYLFNPGRPRELAGYLDQLASDVGLARRMGEYARRHAMQEFSWERHVTRLLEIVNAVKGET